MKYKKAFFLMALCTIFVSAGQLFLKSGMSFVDLDNLLTLLNMHLVLGCAAYCIGTVSMLLAFKDGELSILFPVVATSYVWVSLFSSYFFADSMNLWKWLGMGVIILSVSLLGWGSSRTEVSSVG